MVKKCSNENVEMFGYKVLIYTALIILSIGIINVISAYATEYNSRNNGGIIMEGCNYEEKK